MKPTSRPNGEAASANIAKRIQELGDWRGKTLAHVRQLIHDADPDIQEEWKWVKPTNPETPVWSHDGGVCTVESYKQVVTPLTESGNRDSIIHRSTGHHQTRVGTAKGLPSSKACAIVESTT